MLEAMTVAAIIVILAAMLYPAYTSYAIKARRGAAQTALLELLQQEERYYSQHNRYLAFSADASGAEEKRFTWYVGTRARASGHELSGEACSGQTIEQCIALSATPGTSRVDASFRDPDCGTLTLRSTGEHGASGAHTDCWP